MRSQILALKAAGSLFGLMALAQLGRLVIRPEVFVAGFNLGLLMRQMFGIGKPRRAQDGLAAAVLASLALILAGLRSPWGRARRFCSFSGVAPRRTAYCMAG